MNYVLEMSSGARIEIDEATRERLFLVLGQPAGRWAPLDVKAGPTIDQIIPAYVTRIQRLG